MFFFFFAIYSNCLYKRFTFYLIIYVTSIMVVSLVTSIILWMPGLVDLEHFGHAFNYNLSHLVDY